MYDTHQSIQASALATVSESIPGPSVVTTAAKPIPVHIQTPAEVHGIYLTGWTAGSRSMNRVYGILDTTNVNAVVIDIKDATGRMTFEPLDPSLIQIGVGTKRISDIQNLITKLHEKGVYVIGRIQVFQDPFFASIYPDEAYRSTATLDVWKDRKGIAWLRANSEKTWEYVTVIAKDAYAQGFDEINVDYVRFPSDGDLSTLDKSTFTDSRSDTIEHFFQYLDTNIRGEGIPLSADIFGLTMSTKTGDMGIGQVVSKIAPYVDFVCPMIYPSHYALGSFGYASPSEHPFEIITQALKDGTEKINTIGENPTKLRPWLQDFDLLGVHYDTEKVTAQMRAAAGQGITSWLLWDPRNVYTKDALAQI